MIFQQQFETEVEDDDEIIYRPRRRCEAKPSRPAAVHPPSPIPTSPSTDSTKSIEVPSLVALPILASSPGFSFDAGPDPWQGVESNVLSETFGGLRIAPAPAPPISISLLGSANLLPETISHRSDAALPERVISTISPQLAPAATSSLSHPELDRHDVSSVLYRPPHVRITHEHPSFPLPDPSPSPVQSRQTSLRVIPVNESVPTITHHNPPQHPGQQPHPLVTLPRPSPHPPTPLRADLQTQMGLPETAWRHPNDRRKPEAIERRAQKKAAYEAGKEEARRKGEEDRKLMRKGEEDRKLMENETIHSTAAPIIPIPISTHIITPDEAGISLPIGGHTLCLSFTSSQATASPLASSQRPISTPVGSSRPPSGRQPKPLSPPLRIGFPPSVPPPTNPTAPPDPPSPRRRYTDDKRTPEGRERRFAKKAAYNAKRERSILAGEKWGSWESKDTDTDGSVVMMGQSQENHLGRRDGKEIRGETHPTTPHSGPHHTHSLHYPLPPRPTKSGQSVP